ncbi:MAG TPA: hypothetical protein VFF19_02405 [Reyranella sp.]|nr:hypothetical protein [Reyranella sp.]
MAPAFTTTVTINGVAAVANASGQFVTQPGDTVEITPSQGADWTTTASDGASVSLRNPNISATKWTAQILNGATGAATYTVSAKATANASLTKATVLNVAGGDARNGTYRVYAASALQYLLTLDFNANVYTLTHADGTEPTADTFASDASEPGTYVFKSARITSNTNTSRFRVTTDAIVGAFPFTDPVATGTVYAVKPFLAARKLVTVAAELDGLYNRLGIQRTASSELSQITQTQFSAGGTVYKLCNDSAISSIANCPPASLVTYSVATTDVPGVWLITNVADATDSGRFAMARIGDQNVYLSAGATPATPGRYVLRVGVQDTPLWTTTAIGYGSSTAGSWGRVNFTSTGNTRNAVGTDGTAAVATNVFSNMAGTGPAGMRQISGGGGTYFATYNGKLFAIVGASNATTGGYFQLSLLD